MLKLVPHWLIGLDPSLVISVGDLPTNSGMHSLVSAVLWFYHRGPWSFVAGMLNVLSVADDAARDGFNV